MSRYRSDKEIDELVGLARNYCETMASYRMAKSEDRLTPQESVRFEHDLAALDERITNLKSDNELDRQKARQRQNIVPFLSRSNLRKAR